MFDLFDDIAKGIGKVLGTATGLVVGIPLEVVAKTLELTTTMVEEAINAGCETYEEIKEFHSDAY